LIISATITKSHRSRIVWNRRWWKSYLTGRTSWIIVLLRIPQSQKRGTRCLPQYGKQFAWNVPKCGQPNTECFCMTVLCHISHYNSSPCMILWHFLSLYSPTLSPCNFHFFPHLKDYEFKDAAEVWVTWKNVLQKASCSGIQKFFEQLYKCWQKW
jgi:hypothetical protein